MAHWSLLNALVFIIAKLLNKPYVLCPVGTIPIFGRSKIFKQIYNSVIGNKLINEADAYIAVNQNEALELVDRGIDSAKITIIPNGVNEKEFKRSDIASFRKKFGLGDQPFILFLGRLNLIKGPDLLLKAFCELMHQIPAYNLVFAGPDDGMLKELRTLAANYAADSRVFFVGYLGGPEKSQAYHAADLVVIPSRQEAMSIVVLEAGITGTPVLLTDKCGFNEIEEIDGGAVVPPTVEGLKEGLLALVQDHRELKAKGEKLKKFTAKHYSWNSIGLNYLNLYQKLLANSGNYPRNDKVVPPKKVRSC